MTQKEVMIIIKKEGIITSMILAHLLKKNIRSIIRSLNTLEKWNEIKIIRMGQKRFYIENGLYQNIRKFKGQKGVTF